MSGWTTAPEVAARAGALAVLALAPVAAVGAALAGGGRGALAAAAGALLVLGLQLLTWGAARLARGESAQQLATLLLAASATKAGVVLVLIAALGDRLTDQREPLVLAAGVAVVVSVVAEAWSVARVRAPYVDL